MQRILKEIMKKNNTYLEQQMLGRWDNWPIDSAYYNEDYRIFEISWTLLLIFWILPLLYLLLQFLGKYPGTTFLLHYQFWKHRSKYLHYRPLINDHVTEGNTQVVFLVWVSESVFKIDKEECYLGVTLVFPWCFLLQLLHRIPR